MQFRYALVREGPTDDVLGAIIERYGATRGAELLINHSLSNPFNGPLSKLKIRIRTKSIFDKDAVDVAFYFADRDKGDFNKFEHISEAIKSVSELCLTKSVIGIPDQHMEAWLLADQDAVKRLFGLEGSEPLPFGDRLPKSQLEELANKCGGDELTPPEARRRLAATMDLSVVERTSRSFNHFIGEYNTFLNLSK